MSGRVPKESHSKVPTASRYGILSNSPLSSGVGSVIGLDKVTLTSHGLSIGGRGDIVFGKNLSMIVFVN